MADIDETEWLTPENEEQLWTELNNCVSTKCDSHEAIDNALRTWLDVTTKFREGIPEAQEEVLACAQALLRSRIYQDNRAYCRTQIIHSLLQEDESGPLHAIICLLLLDGHHDESTFPAMISETCFPRLLELLSSRDRDDDPRLNRFLLHLIYEMSRMERLKVEELALVNDDFIHSLFRIIESISNDIDDPYHYPIIRVLLVLNEQYMLASTDMVTKPGSAPEPLTNRIVKCLSLHGPLFRTFGENIILLLNRETETSLQLLTLKLLYLLFTTKATYEYFYTNDLRVLLDVIIRNLMDLPDERMALRHTYLRVLYPLLAHTQLNQPPHYKKEEVTRLLRILRGSQNAHFAPADDTTLRLVDRVSKVKWLEDEECDTPKEGSGQAEIARKLLGISLSPTQTASSISVVDIAAVTEKPGVQTPSRTNGVKAVDEISPLAVVLKEAVVKTGTKRQKKPLPAIPTHKLGVTTTTSGGNNKAGGTDHLNGNGHVKKIPPKAPPPRRGGKARAPETASSESVHQVPQ